MFQIISSVKDLIKFQDREFHDTVINFKCSPIMKLRLYRYNATVLEIFYPKDHEFNKLFRGQPDNATFQISKL